MSTTPPAPKVQNALSVERKTPSVEALSQIVEGLRREDRREQLRSLLGSDAAVDRFITITIHAIGSNSDILEKCTPVSILEAVREAATLDLEPTGILGEAWIVRHGNRAVLRVGYRGFLKLIRRSNHIAAVDCQIVYDADHFEVALGTEAAIFHRPSLGERGAYRGAYAWARTRGGELIIEWMSTADIEQVRAVSQAKNAGPWSDWWGEMARKSVIRRLAKRLPLATIAENALAVDEEADAIESGREPVRVARQRTLALLAGEKSKEPEPQPQPGELDEEDKAAIDKAMNEALGEPKA